MDWSNERYVRVYTRDTPRTLVLPWQARCLFWELLRKVDRAGVLDLGDAQIEALAVTLGCPLEEAESALGHWLKQGRVVISDGQLVVPNYIEAQESTQSNAARSRAARERRRMHAIGRSTDGRDATDTQRPDNGTTWSQRDATDTKRDQHNGTRVDTDTKRDEVQQNVSQPTRCDTPSVPNQPCRAVPCRSVSDTHTPQSGPTDQEGTNAGSPERAAIESELESHRVLEGVRDLPALAEQIEGRRMSKGTPLAWTLTAIGEAVRDLAAESAGSGAAPQAAVCARTVLRYCDHARAPHASPEPEGLDPYKCRPPTKLFDG